jgi:hypothetical protein
LLSYEERSQIRKKDMVWNKFVEVTKFLELQWDEYVFEYWSQLRRDPMYVKSMMSVENSEMLSILDKLSNWKEDCRDDPLEPGAMVFFQCPLVLSILRKRQASNLVVMKKIIIRHMWNI